MRSVVVLVLAGALGIVTIGPRFLSTATAGVATLAPPPPGDTTTVYGPHQFATPNGNATNLVERFGTTVNATRRYILRMTNGNANGTLRATSGSVTLNGSPIFSSGDIASGASFNRVVQVRVEDTLLVTVSGVAGAFVTLTTLSMPDSSFLVFGPERFPRGTGAPVTEVRYFSIAPTAAPPYRMCIKNGNDDGTDRVSSATVVLNGTTVLTQSDVNQQVASLMKEVTLHPVDTLEVTLNSTPGSFLDLCITATDTTPPTIAITAPPPNFITNDTIVTVAGVVHDQTQTTVTVNGQTATLTDSSFTATAHLAVEGQNVIHIVATDAPGHVTDSIRTVIRDTQAPVLTVTSPADGLITNQTSVTVSGSVTDQTAVVVNVNGIQLSVDGNGNFTGTAPLNEGTNVLVVTATDAAGNPQSAMRVVKRDTQAPVITLNQPAEGDTIVGETATLSGTVVDSTSVTLTANGVPITVGQNGAFTGSVPLVVGPNTITLIATDAATNTATLLRHVVRKQLLPPDPSTVASVLNRAEVTTIKDATAFLYTGANPIQTGLDTATIKPVQAAVLRGKVRDRTFQALGGATVSILGHPELGQTLSRADGGWDLAVNGGAPLTVNFAKSGYFPAQRAVDVPWQDYTTLDDVILLQPDTVVTVVDLTSQTPAAARGSMVTDADGQRQASMIFKPGMTATITPPGGSPQPITTLSMRLTEYTVGDSGPLAMPGDLPPASHYTYAVQLSADTQLAVPGTQIAFSQPVPFYVTKFLPSIPDTVKVPVGSYNATTGAWVPLSNGMGLKVVSIVNGRAQLDVTGDGVADPTNTLLALGIDDYEQLQLAGLYPAGTDLWRALAPKVEPLDVNFPFVFVGVPPTDGKVKAGCSSREGDPLRCQLQAQTAFQSVGLVGSPFTLNYASDRTKGNVADRKLDITLTGATLPAQLLRVEFEIDVAGQRFRGSFPNPTPNLTYPFTWDGKDIYGRLTQGTQPATVLIGYVFPIQYAAPANAVDAFGQPCSPTGTGSVCTIFSPGTVSARAEQVTVQRLETSIGTLDATALGLGGFTLDVQNVYDPVGEVLYNGDGTRRATAALPPGIKTVIGNGTGGPGCNIGEGQSALLVCVGQVGGITFGPDGSVYYSDIGIGRVRKVTPDGIVHTVAGGGTSTGDSVLATQARLGVVRGLALGPDGSLYIADQSSNTIRRLLPNGILKRFAGSGSFGFAGDSGQALNAALSGPAGIALGSDGSLYLADRTRLRRIGPDGIIMTLAGSATVCRQEFFSSCGDGGPAIKATLGFLADVHIGADGTIYLLEFGFDFKVRRITPDGTIRAIAGGNGGGTVDAGDGGLATLAAIGSPVWLALGADRSLYIGEAASDGTNNRVRRVTPNGIITTFAGTGVFGFSGDGGPAAAAKLNRTSTDAIGMGPDGNLYIGGGNRIRRVRGVLPGFGAGQTVIASEDGSELYVFSTAGRLLSVLDATTRATLFSFGYDSTRRLVSIADRDERVTTLERDASGKLLALVAPTGQRTPVTIDSNGNLTSLSDPAGHALTLAYSQGLLSTATDPNSKTQQFVYDANGQLTQTTSPDGGVTGTSISGSQAVFRSAEGDSVILVFQTLADGSKQAVQRSPSGLTTTITMTPAGVTTTQWPDGATNSTTQRGDPQLDLQVPLADRVAVTPSGLTRTLTHRVGLTLTDPADPSTAVARTDTVVLNGRVTTYQVDSRTLAGTVQTAAGRREALRFDSAGRTVFDSTTGIAALRSTFDTTGRLLTTVRGGRLWRYGYDPQGRLASTTDPAGMAEHFEYDSAGRVVSRTRFDGTVIRYGYSLAGDLLTITPPGRPAHQFQYTSAGLPLAYVPPTVSGAATTTRYELDSAGRLLAVALPSGDSIKISYDGDGRRTLITTSEGFYSIGFDPATGRQVSSAAPSGAVLNYQYDGRLPTRVALSGPVNGGVSLSYDADFRVSTERVNDSAATSVTYAYDADGLVSTVGALTVNRNSANGLMSGTSVGSLVTSLTRDSLAQPTHTTAALGSTTFLDQTYTRDVTGRITHLVESVQGQSHTADFGYDSLGRLKTVTRDGQLQATYEYDANGNRTRFTGPSGTSIGVVDDQDRLSAYGSATYSNGSNGERQTRTSAGATTSYRYNSFRDLTGVTLPGGTQIDYLLDPDHRRIGVLVNGHLDQRFVYGTARGPVADLDSLNRVVTRYVYGSRSTVPDYFTRDGRTFAIVTDQVGSARLVVDASSGEVMQRLDYDEFGRVLLDTRPGFQPFGFGGGLYDSRTSLVHFGARDYDPETGRWMSKDPALFDGGSTNLYEYASNDPVNRADPGGYDGTLAEVAVTGAIGNVLTGFAIARLTGQSYSAGDAVRDATIGAVTGVAGKFLGGLFGVARKAKLLASGRIALYQGFDLATDELVYVGITNDLERRAAEQLLERGIKITAIEGLENLSIEEARAVEQALIEFYGGKSGGRLLNLINSISPLRPDYEELVAHGRDLLRLVGFPIN